MAAAQRSCSLQQDGRLPFLTASDLKTTYQQPGSPRKGLSLVERPQNLMLEQHTSSSEAPKASAERDVPARLGDSSRLAATISPSGALGWPFGSGSLYAEPACESAGQNCCSLWLPCQAISLMCGWHLAVISERTLRLCSVKRASMYLDAGPTSMLLVGLLIAKAFLLLS